MAAHHRRRRRDGGDSAANLVALHTACHQWVHANPVEATERGLIISAFTAQPPGECPVLIGDRWWTLTDAWTREPWGEESPVPAEESRS
jgi:hypothetical protein